MARRLLTILIILLIQQVSNAQGLPRTQKERNEILTKLQENLPDTVRVDLIWELGKSQLAKAGNFKINLDSALNYFQYSIKVCDSLRIKPSYKYEAMCRIGETYFLLKDFRAGKNYFMQVIAAYQTANDKGREARTWLRMAIKLKNSDLKQPEIPYYQEKALALYRKLNNQQKEGDVLQETGIYYWLNSQLDSAERKLLGAVKVYKLIRYNQLALAFYYLSEIYRNEGNFNKSLSYALQSVDNSLATRDTALNLFYYGQLGRVYSDLKKPDKSIENYKISVHKSIALASEREAPDYAYYFVTELVRMLVASNKINQAVLTADQFIKRYPPADSLQKGNAAEMKGIYNTALKRYTTAEKYYSNMVKFYRGHDLDESWGFNLLGKFYMDEKKYDKARQTFQIQFIRSPSRGLPFVNLIDDELLYFKIDSARGDLTSAIDHLKKYKILNDSAFNITKSKQLEELQVQYETKQKENDIKLLKKDGQLQREQLTRADNSRNLILVGVAILILFLAMLYNSYRIKQKNNVSLNQLIKEKDSLLTEKEWLLKEIHHRVKNNLQIVMGLLQRQSAYVDNNEALEAIQNSENRMRSIALIHQKLYQSDNLDLINMPEYINDLINNLKDSCDLGIRLYFEKEIDELYFDVAQAVPLGLILNEAITNAIKYAYPNDETGTIKVSLTQAEDEVNTLIIADNGIGLPTGFDMEKINSLGMNLMKGLSKQLAGRFSISSQNGVIITISFKTEKFACAWHANHKTDYM